MRVPPIPELASPLPVVGVALLALNDRVLKARWPGSVTGKLSDVAGCFVLPLFLSALLALATGWPLRVRLAVGATASAVFFAALKVSQVTADAVCGVLVAVWTPLGLHHARIVADPTDLIALPLVGAAWLYGVRAAGRGAAS